MSGRANGNERYGLYQSLSEAQQYERGASKEPSHANSPENAILLEESRKMKERSQKMMKIQIFTNDYLLCVWQKLCLTL